MTSNTHSALQHRQDLQSTLELSFISFHLSSSRLHRSPNIFLLTIYHLNIYEGIWRNLWVGALWRRNITWLNTASEAVSWPACWWVGAVLLTQLVNLWFLHNVISGFFTFFYKINKKNNCQPLEEKKLNHHYLWCRVSKEEKWSSAICQSTVLRDKCNVQHSCQKCLACLNWAKETCLCWTPHVV